MILAPSILSADFGRLAEQIALAEKGGAGAVHVDVMDGHFVPNLTIGPPVVKAVRQATSLPLDVHLMIENADRYLDAFVEAGASWISVHVEALPHLQRSVAHLRGRGIKAGVALNPGTPLGAIEEILPELDYVLVMSVNPGFGGQSFIERALDKLSRARQLLEARNPACELEVDGGVKLANAAQVAQAGATVVVAGSFVYAEGGEVGANISALRAQLNAGGGE
jgi:ribulose-phosphate 3-epimerase